jgi:two-component system cell cycle sensor histidine kinase/response regulator CckA
MLKKILLVFPIDTRRTMTSRRRQRTEERLEKIRAENEAMREKLAAARKEQKDLQRLMKEKEAFLNDLPVAIVVLQDEKIVDANPTALNLLGYTMDEVIGRYFIDFVDPDSRETVLEIHKNRSLGKWAPDQYETHLVAKDSAVIQVDIRVARIRYGRRSAFVGRLETVEERKQEERKLVESKKAESLRTMAAGLSGSLRQPLQVISEKLTALKKKSDPRSASSMESLDRIGDAVSQMMTLNRALEGICRSVPERSEMRPCDLRKIVNDVIITTEPRLEEKVKDGVEIDLKTYLRPVSLVQANPAELQELIFHIMNNAVEAMPQGGDLYVSTEENAGYAYVFIQDSGIGLPEHLQTRVFDPFFTTKGDERTGLGLSLSQGIVRRHQGTLEITSRKGQGTIVSIRIPLAGYGEKIRKGVARKKIKDAHILIIEDDYMVRELLCQLLKSKGYRVIPAANGVEGLHHLRKKRVDMAIIGTQTPDIEGRALAREIKRGNDKLPVALIATQEDTDRAELSYVDLIITKPLDMKMVFNQIANLLTLGAADS